MFGIGKIFRRKHDDEFDDLRTHVLGDKFRPDPEFDQPRRAENFTPRTKEVFEPYNTRPDLEPPGLQTDMDQQQDFPPAGPPSPFAERQPPMERTAEKVNRDYEIMERLAMIENQIAVIRSQTETINERLKNLDARLSQGQRPRY